jgi:hypothetical protein
LVAKSPLKRRHWQIHLIIQCLGYPIKNDYIL